MVERFSLTEEQIQQLTDAHRQLQEVKEFCRLCRQAGLDMTEYESQIERLEALTKGLLRTFARPRKPLT